MKEYKEKSSFRHLGIITDVYIGLLSSLIVFIVLFSASNPINELERVDIFGLFVMMIFVLTGGCRARQYFQWDKTIWIDKDRQIVEVEFYKGAFLRYNYRKIPFSDLEIKFAWERIGPKPSNRAITGLEIIDKGEYVISCISGEKWTNGGFDELVAEFSSIKEEYCEKKTDVQM